MKLSNINLLYADEKGQLQNDADLIAIGMNGRQVETADPNWIDLPAGSEILLLPGRLPLGFNSKQEELEVIENALAVAAILPVGYTRCLLPGYEIEELQELPLFGYAAIGNVGDQIKVAAMKTDEDLKWNPIYYNTPDLPRLISQKTTSNRITNQLAKCAVEYHCLTAQNIFYKRWEAGIPVSPNCNANCIGCISKQPSECCPSPQGRIKFVPEVTEIVELAVNHLENAGDAIISFGQGCEGEPSLQRELLVNAIKEIRNQTTKGILNINSNAGYYESIKDLVDAGLDSIRISLFSAIPVNYNWYHRPEGYQLDNVRNSICYAAEHGVTVALNLLFFPGFNNQRRETEALYKLIAATGVKQVQIRNLNLDPEKMKDKLNEEELPSIWEWINGLREAFPTIHIGNYTKSKF